MKRHADSVMQTSTVTPSLTNNRVSSAVLYAAIPPVRPITILDSGVVSIIPLANASATARSLHCPRLTCRVSAARPRNRGELRNGAMRVSELPFSERPRERLLLRGAVALSDAELIALLLRTGTAGHSAMDIARALITRFGGVAGVLGGPVAEVARVHGVGLAKCAGLTTVVELARRSLSEEARSRDALASPQAVRDYLRLLLAARPYEVFVGLSLDSQNGLLAADELFRGTLGQTSVYPREVVKAALAHNAAAMICRVRTPPHGGVLP